MSEIKDMIIRNSRSLQPYEIIPCSGLIIILYLDGRMACLARLTQGLPLIKRGLGDYEVKITSTQVGRLSNKVTFVYGRNSKSA